MKCDLCRAANVVTRQLGPERLCRECLRWQTNGALPVGQWRKEGN
jgi:hypothetical protein